MQAILAILRELLNFFLMVTWTPPFTGIVFLVLVGVLMGFVVKPNISYFLQFLILVVSFIASAIWPVSFLYTFPFLVLFCGNVAGIYMRAKWELPKEGTKEVGRRGK